MKPVRVISRARRRALMAAWTAAALLFLLAAAWVNLRRAYGGMAFTARAAGKVAGLLAAGLFVMQFALSARIKALDRAFALDRLLRLHKYIGATAATLALLHPFLIYARAGSAPSALTLELWPEIVGAVAILLALVVVATSLWRVFLEIPFETWRAIHQLTFAIVIAVGVHSLVLGSDLKEGWASAFWWAMLAGYAALFVWVKIVKPVLLKRKAFKVSSVTRASHDTWNIELAPAGRCPAPIAARRSVGAPVADQRASHARTAERCGAAQGPGLRPGFDYLPGQFAFLTLRGPDIRREEHPFTISSSPARGGALSFTIKESGDFTRTVGRVKAGDTATVDGPYGQFSHLVQAEEGEDLLFIAGGVGITPILSMLRYMAETDDRRRVTLVWGNKAEDDILFRGEIEGFAAKIADFKVHHVLSNAPGWGGPKGFVTGQILGELLCEEELKRRVFLCGPPVMMDLVTSALVAVGVSRRRIHTERFAL